MTVAELMEKLESMPRDMLVLVSGYEGGMTAKLKVNCYEVVHNPEEDQEYFGEYDIRPVKGRIVGRYALAIERIGR